MLPSLVLSRASRGQRLGATGYRSAPERAMRKEVDAEGPYRRLLRTSRSLVWSTIRGILEERITLRHRRSTGEPIFVRMILAHAFVAVDSEVEGDR